MKRMLSLVLSLGLLAGCTAAPGEADGRKPMGRYIENESAALGDLGRVEDFCTDENGDVVFYAQEDKEAGGGAIKRYTVPKDGGAVNEADAPWLDELMGKDYYPSSISSDGNGTVYALCAAPNGVNALFRSVDGGATSEQVTVSDWPAPAEEGAASGGVAFAGGVSVGTFNAGMSGAGTRYASGVIALADGGFVIGYADQGACVYRADGTKTADFPGTAFGKGFAVSGNQLLMQSQDVKELWLYDLGKTERQGSYAYDNLSYGTTVGLDADGLFVGDSTGVYRQGVDGSLWEKLVDGDLTSLVMPDQEIAGLTGDGSGGFWAILRAEEGARIVRYTYDAETPTNPDTELTVFSLKDNATVRQTIGEFQRRNPTVRVNFRVAQTSEGAATTEDVIRALNTELLSGKAPDILLLDGLPADSYIEKNVLLDLTDLVKELTGVHGLLENLMNAYEKDGKIYGVPARFTFPVMMGGKDALDGMTSLETLVERTEARQGEEVPFLHPSGELWEDDGMLMKYYNACVNAWSSGRDVDQGGLERYFESMMALNTVLRTHTPQAGGEVAVTIMTVSSVGGGTGYEELSMGPMALGQNQARFHIQELNGILNLQNILSKLGSKEGYGLDTLFGGGAYTPVGGVGIVASGKQQDLSKDFVELLLSDTVQGKYLYDGFPVNGKSLEKMAAEQVEEAQQGSFTMAFGDGPALPDAPAAQTNSGDMGFMELCRSLDAPILTDEVIKAAAEAQIKGLLDGRLTPKAAAENVVKSTALYRAE